MFANVNVIIMFLSNIGLYATKFYIFHCVWNESPYSDDLGVSPIPQPVATTLLENNNNKNPFLAV